MEFLRYADIPAVVGIELAEADRTCQDLIEANRSALIAVARRLFERSSVVGAEIAALLEAARSKEPPKQATPERGVVLRLVDDPGRQEGPCMPAALPGEWWLREPKGSFYQGDGCPIPCSSRSARADRSASSLRAGSLSSFVVTFCCSESNCRAFCFNASMR